MNDAILDIFEGVLIAERGLAEEDIAAVAALTFTDLPPHHSPRARIDEDHWLLEGYLSVSRIDLRTDTVTPLYRGIGEVVGVRSDGFELLKLPPCCYADDFTAFFDDGPLWFVPYEGAARQLAPRATRYGYPLADGRRVDIVDLVDRGDGLRGTLLVTDTATQEARQIDRDVPLSSSRMTPPEVFGDDVVVYSLGGDRAGIWIARLPPAP